MRIESDMENQGERAEMRGKRTGNVHDSPPGLDKAPAETEFDVF